MASRLVVWDPEGTKTNWTIRLRRFLSILVASYGRPAKNVGVRGIRKAWLRQACSEWVGKDITDLTRRKDGLVKAVQAFVKKATEDFYDSYEPAQLDELFHVLKCGGHHASVAFVAKILSGPLRESRSALYEDWVEDCSAPARWLEQGAQADNAASSQTVLQVPTAVSGVSDNFPLAMSEDTHVGTWNMDPTPQQCSHGDFEEMLAMFDFSLPPTIPEAGTSEWVNKLWDLIIAFYYSTGTSDGDKAKHALLQVRQACQQHHVLLDSGGPV